MAGIYDFTPAMQEKILAVLWRDSYSYAVYQTVIKPRYFKSVVHIDLCRIILDYYEQYKKSPSKTVILEEIEELSKSKSKAPMREEYLKTLLSMAKIPLDDLDYMRDKILAFGKKQAMVDSILQSAEIIEKGGEYSKVEELIKTANLVGEDINDLGIDIFTDIEERLLSYANDTDVIERIPTGIALLDNLTKGGLGRTEMGVIIAPPGKGKTSFMIDKGAEAVLHGYNVVHYSLENNEKQIARNYDIRLVSKDIDYIKTNIDAVNKALLRIKKLKKGELVIKKYPAKSVNINAIMAHLRQLEVVRDFRPDMIIIDYGALLKPLDNFKEKRDGIEDNYIQIRALADEFNCAVWTGAQGNRGSLSKKLVSMEDLAECFAIANVADMMLAICQTLREKESNVFRLFIAKNRDAEDRLTLSGEMDLGIKKFTLDKVVAVGEDDEDEDEETEDALDSRWKSKKKRKCEE